MKSPEIRKKFLNFFKKHGHTIVPSSSLIPAQDPTLLFANAGMNQFKDVFLGKEKRSYSRAASIQKCMRAGGKHNDLDNVGFTKRHLTFFEMMGNFSFGDYFKKEAIRYAWDFLTKDMGFKPDSLYISVYQDDDESYDIWHKEIGVPKNRIFRLGAEDNFWQMGDTGPCGPCSEIYVDRGKEFGCGKDSCAPGCDCDRFLEVWNLVFMQYDRQPDGTDVPLKQKGVDTGMGFERLAVIMQDKDSVFETDLFMPIIHKIEELSGKEYKKQTEEMKAAFHVLADHIRAATFLIADGCSPSNEGRGYVLRKIIRRAALFARKLTDKNIFPQLADVVIEQMKNVYPELETNQKIIKTLIKNEIEKFSTNLEHGQEVLEKYLEESKATKQISGEQAFKLYDTFGFPLELTMAIARQKGYSLDQEKFEELMEEQRKRSGKKMKETVHEKVTLPADIDSQFTGYDDLQTESKVVALIKDNELVDAVEAHSTCWVITEQSPFYVERGGQVSDEGSIIIDSHEVRVNKLKRFDEVIAAEVKTPIKLSVGDTVIEKVDKQKRLATMKNHTATHLLQSALIQIFGKQIKQSGSLVAPDYLRFDFTFHENLTPEQIKRVEDIVNEKIQENIPVSTQETTYKNAISQGVIAFFGDKYNPDSVRVVNVPDFSAELCGGTHVKATGDIGCFKITEVSALSAGQRRIVALTGPKAIELFQDSFATVKTLSQEFKVKPDEVISAVQKQKELVKELQSKIKQLKKQSWKAQIPHWLENVETIDSIPFLFLQLEEFGNEDLREIADTLCAKKPGFYFLVSAQDSRVNFYAQVSEEYENSVNMKELAQWLRENTNLKGGGKKLTLQGGGASIEKDLHTQIIQWLKDNK